jgi:hypothetical protein
MGQNEKGRKQKNVFKIFQAGWEDFKTGYPRYEEVDEVVQKMLGCGEFENGYAEYLCPECLNDKRVPFSCKSSFCLSWASCTTVFLRDAILPWLHLSQSPRSGAEG